MLQFLPKCFSYIKEFSYLATLNNNTRVPESFSILGFTNKENEKVSYLKELNFLYKDHQNKLPIFSMFTMIEEASLSFFKNNIYKNFLNYSKNAYDFTVLWRQFIGKSLLNQTALLINEICFYHDLTSIIACFNTADDIQVNLVGFLETLKTNLQAFFVAFKEQKNKDNPSKAINHRFLGEMLLQILNFIEIVKFFISKKIESIASFEFFSLPKLGFEANKTVFEDIAKRNSASFFNNVKEKTRSMIQNYVYSTIPNIAGSSQFLNILLMNQNKEDFNLNITLSCFNYKVAYGYEMGFYQNKFYPSFISKRLILNIISGISFMDGILIKGPLNSGKKETFKVFKIKIFSKIIKNYLVFELLSSETAFFME